MPGTSARSKRTPQYRPDDVRYFGIVGASAGALRPARPVTGNVQWFPPVAQGTAKVFAWTDRTRMVLIIVNRSASQTLMVAPGTLDSDAAAPSSGAYISVPAGQELPISADARPWWAYFPTTSEAVQVYTENTV